MSRSFVAFLPVLALLLCGAGICSASTVITFDEFSGTSTVIPNGYFGFNWNTMYSVDGLQYPGSGYDHGAVSGVRTAFNGYVGPTPPMSVTGNPFNFDGAYFTAAWSNGLSVTVEGYRSGTLKYTSTFTVDTAGPTFEPLNYVDIDALRFRSIGSQGDQFAMDNFTFSPVPEPHALILFVNGLVAIAWRRTRRPANA